MSLRGLALVVAAAAGGVLVADAVPWVPMTLDGSVSRLVLAVGVVAVTWLMVTARSRPLGAAYELGYETARRDVLQLMNSADPVTSLRRQVRFERLDL